VISVEFLILGGGPAGCAAGRLLALLGHRVRLITRPDNPRARLAESLPPSTRKLFKALSVGAAMARAGFVRSTGNTVWWGASDGTAGPDPQALTPSSPRVEMFPDGERGWQVDAGRLEHVLLQQAEAAGATIERRAATTADLDHPFVLDCTGRTGLLARARRHRRYDEGPRTVALGGNWRRKGAWPVPDDSHTLLEAYADGWAWSMPLARGERQFAVMVDPQHSALARGAPARDLYLAELAKTRALGPLTQSARLVAGPWGWDVTAYHADRYAGDGWLLVGDAGSTIDPLSSAGAQKALASGWLAAIVANTCARHPERRAAAQAFFSARERDVVDAYRGLVRRHLARGAAGQTGAFWFERVHDTVQAGAHLGREAAADMPDAAVREAFERLRRAPTLAVQPGRAFVVEPRPAVSGFEIVLEPRIVGRGDPHGVRYVADVDVIALVEQAPQASDVGELFERYCRVSAPVALPDFLRALATAVARGWLVAQ
jgi:2-polyprenyl-6-methoxyphenol hydroxylase-like FAD-dependent oxidoreductase